MIYTFQTLAALFLDFLFGDPQWYPHPVRWIGLACRAGEKVTRKYINNLILAGFFTVIFVLIITGGTVILVLTACYSVSIFVGDFAAVVLLYTTFAAKDLIYQSGEVLRKLAHDSDLGGARDAVGRIVGRDTISLDNPEISRACVETVAENMVDGITAPFFYAVVFSFFAPYVDMTAIGCSVVGAFLYKAINTMDSMIGYKNVKYLEFGRIAARLDDGANFIPSRMSAAMVVLAACTLNLDYKRAFKIIMRDRLNHSSPNAGHTEAAFSGALGVRLGGPALYLGKVVNKPYIGDDVRKIQPDAIKTSHKLVLVGSLYFIASILILRAVILFFK
jgi:adenosylcobinamide-phosphate synthase